MSNIHFVYADCGEELELKLKLLLASPQTKLVTIYGLNGKHWAWVMIDEPKNKPLNKGKKD